jgi:hypothetical protein
VANYFPGMDKRLTQIVFSALSGMVYVHIEGYWHMTWVRVPRSEPPDEAEFSVPRPDRYKWRIEDLPGVAPFIANDVQVIRGPKVQVKNPPPPIVNPITAEMVSYYAAWTPANSIPTYYQAVIQDAGGPTQTWIIDRAQYQLVYAGAITARGSPVMSRDEALAHFQSDPTLDPSKVGVIIAQVYDANGNHDPPMPPSQEGWTFWNNAAAQSGWAGHLETGPTPQPYRGEMYGINLMINPATLASSMTPAQRTAKEFKFKIIPEADGNMKQEIRLYWFTKPNSGTLRTDYPVEPAERFYRPVLPGDDENWDVTTFTRKEVGDKWFAGDYLEVTVKLSPFEVSYRLVITDHGGDEEG